MGSKGVAAATAADDDASLQQQAHPRRLTSGDCVDTDNDATNPYGDGCDDYAGIPSWCGDYDGANFSSNDMCCACGGGTDEAPTPAPTAMPGPTTGFLTKMSIAPNALRLSATKPSVATSSFFVANINPWPLEGSATVHNTTLPTTNVSISPATLVIPSGELVEIFISLPSSGLEPRVYTIDVGIDADPPDTVATLPVHLTLPIELGIFANADARMSQVAISGTPIVDAPWRGIQLTPFDADGFRIQTDQKEDFAVSLSSHNLTASCDIVWRKESTSYEGACTVPDVGRAGDWILTITLDDQLVFSYTVYVWCQEDYYMRDDGVCSDCPGAAVCLAGSTLKSLHLKPFLFLPNERDHIADSSVPSVCWLRGR